MKANHANDWNTHNRQWAIVCSVCGAVLPPGTVFCLNCAGAGAQAEGPRNVVARLAEGILRWAVETAQVGPQDILREAAKFGVVVNTIEDLDEVDIERLDRIADRWIRAQRLRATVSGIVTGLPAGPWAVAAIPADISALVFFSFRCISGVAQIYGNSTATEEGKAQMLIIFAAALGMDRIILNGVPILIQRLQRLILSKPYRDMMVLLLMKHAARHLGISITKRTFARVVPLFGAVIGGGANYAFMTAVGQMAKRHYRAVTLERREATGAGHVLE